MEHIVQFGITVDDNVIKERIAANAEKVVVNEIKEEIKKKIFNINCYTDCIIEKSPFSSFMEKMIFDFLEENKEEIVGRTSVLLSEKLVRTKAVKEAIADVIADNMKN